jgi:hypothetical protein
MNTINQLLIGLFLIFFVACEQNGSPDEILPEFGSISGDINFSGTWPNTGEVLLTLNTQYPVTGPPAGFTYITSDSLSDNIYNYNFSNLSFRNYAALTVTYWPAGYTTGGSNYSTIGIYEDSINVTQDIPEYLIDIDAVFN